jgi:hypothetical protein
MTDERKPDHHEKDQDCGKGAVEQSEPGESGNTSLRGQLGHRGQPPLVKQSDTDFPEPGGNPAQRRTRGTCEEIRLGS